MRGNGFLRSLHLARFVPALIVLCALPGATVSAAKAQVQKPAPVITDNPGDTQEAPPWSSPDEPKRPNVTAYTLPPNQYAKARRLNRIGYAQQFFIPLYEILTLGLFLRLGWSRKIRNVAEVMSRSVRRGGSQTRPLRRRSSAPDKSPAPISAGEDPKSHPVANGESVPLHRVAQSAIYATLLLLALKLFLLPLEILGHSISLSYGISIETWPAWLWDRAKAQLLATIIGAILLYIFFAVVRKSPKRWWLDFWLATMPLAVFFIFIAPYVVDPMFNQFEPLAAHDAPLAESLEKVVARAGLQVPVDRMYWMKASEKVTELNAYVTGLGASKRVVVWDTTIAKMTRPEIAYVFGHEMGHYVLQHIPKGFALGAPFSLLLFYLAYRMSALLLRKRTARWNICGPDDLAATPVYLACILLLAFVATPLTNAVSRYFEHQADRYGLEVTHGLTPDSAQVAAQSFQILGEVDMEDPAPNRFEIFWFYDHPWIGDRIQFALHYDPWSKGGTGDFVK
jgi:Zn-dependent protease with chaperone function